MRVTAVLLSVLLAGCAGGVRLRSPVKEAPSLQSPVSVEAPKPELCPPVYKPVVEHDDSGEDPCPNGVCRIDRKPTGLPGYTPKQKKPAPSKPWYSSPVFGWSAFGLSILGLVIFLLPRRSK